jgi:serine/threonine protein kinase
MPFNEGESLRQRLDREGPLPVAEAVAIAATIAGALDYAHHQGIVHRDIKPENILLHTGQAMVSDFGIARANDAAAGETQAAGTLTSTGVLVGTPRYMSPEQVLGDPADARTDVYALGCVLYEMLAGTPPFSGPTAQAVRPVTRWNPCPWCGRPGARCRRRSEEDLTRHPMHSEVYEVGPAAAATINDRRAAGGHVWAVGTTVARTLETVADTKGRIRPAQGETALFIHPPHAFRVVDRLLTNFHLPRSTLLMLVCAFGGYEQVMRAYAEAVRERYRFYSYGDAMAVI